MHDFWSVPLKSGLVMETHAVEDGRFLKQYQKGSLEKSMIH